MIIRHNLITTTTLIITSLIVIREVECDGKNAVDCKKIDNQKFKELFQFSYGGGQKGLVLNFNFYNKIEFKVGNCKFKLSEGKYYEGNLKSYKRVSNNKLDGLKACKKYRLELTIKNMANNATIQYQNFVTTRPDGNMVLELITSNVSDSSVTFKTTTSVSDTCFTRYHLIVENDRKEVVYDNSSLVKKEISIDNLISSQTYSARIHAFDDKGSKISSKVLNFKTKSSKLCNEINEPHVALSVKNLTSDSVRLKWTSNTSDVVYHLEIFELSTGNSVLSANFSNDSTVIKNLTACREYTARMIIPCATKIATANFRTLSSRPGDVKEIHLNSNHTHSMISWTPPEINVDCITNYLIKYQKSNKSNDSPSFTVEKNKTSLVLPILPPSKNLVIHVYANSNTPASSSPQSYSLTSKEFKQIDYANFVVHDISEFRLSPTELQLRWSLNITFLDVLKGFQIFHNGEVFNATQPLINLKIDACGKNYSISIQCLTNDENFGPSITYDTNLDDDSVQLSAISQTSFSLEQKTNNSFEISWKAIKEETPCIDYYDIILNDKHSKSVEPLMVFNDYLPCITYSIQVTPVSHTGVRGKISNYEFTTNVIAPEIPSIPEPLKIGNRELNLSVVISKIDKYCSLMSPTYIDYECNGIIVSLKIEEDQSTYSALFNGLHPNTQYKCTALVRNAKGSSPKSEAAVFTTLQDSPQPPENIKFTVYTNNSILVNWHQNNSTGYADYFKIHVRLEKLLYDTPTDCIWNLKNYSIVEAISEKQLINDLVAYAEYSLKILSINVHGSSNFSEEKIFRTFPSPSTTVRDVSVDFKTFENSTVSAYLLWKSPCKINGKFSLYTVSMSGSRKGFAKQNDVIAGQMNHIELKNLRMGFKYNIEIKANVFQPHEHNDLSGIPAKFSFVTPSGIPLPEDLIEWTNPSPAVIHHNQVELYLKRRIFISSIGDITGVSFLLFLKSCPDLPQPTFGYLTSDTQILPSSSLHVNMNCSQLYQQTDILQNPLDHDIEIESSKLDVYNIKYILGDGKCSTNKQYCNGPLQPATEYGLIARIFTKDGFRDTEAIYFETKAKSSFPFSPMVFVAMCLSALILVSILIAICCWVSIRRQRKMKKKKEAAETVDNLLSFTSYCVIDKNPTPRNQFDHLL